MPTPSVNRFYQLQDRALQHGLRPEAAWGYAVLSWWGEHYGLTAPRITSGRRSSADQLRLWRNRRNNRYPVARPGTSKHERGLAFDLPRGPHLEAFGHWAPLVGLRWGGLFSRPDPIHFEVE